MKTLRPIDDSKFAEAAIQTTVLIVSALLSDRHRQCGD